MAKAWAGEFALSAEGAGERRSSSHTSSCSSNSEVPPRVDYELTPLGRSFLAHMVPLWTWLLDNAEDFRAARVRFDDA
jgi:hypothetical protein